MPGTTTVLPVPVQPYRQGEAPTDTARPLQTWRGPHRQSGGPTQGLCPLAHRQGAGAL